MIGIELPTGAAVDATVVNPELIHSKTKMKSVQPDNDGKDSKQDSGRFRTT